MTRSAPTRRLVTVPAWFVLTLACLVLSPLIAVVARLVALVARGRQPLLLARFTLTYLLLESAALVACGGLWVLSGAGAAISSERFQRAHYRLLWWLLDRIVAEGLASLRIGVDLHASPDAEAALGASDRPLILLSRHAGPGDSLLLVHLLLTRYRRRPRIVMKQALAIDPCIDLLCHRLPNALLDTSDRDACEREIERLASGLGGKGVLVLFPEGGNFTPERRSRAIARLRRGGRRRRAAQAERMIHVMPPKPNGALSALAGNPDADVIFSAHTGLGKSATAGQLLRQLPTGRSLHVRLWHSSADERPTDADEQVEWLFDWWRRLDEWIERQGTESEDG